MEVRDGFAQVIKEGSTLIHLYDSGATEGEVAAQAKVLKTSVGDGRRAIDTFRDVQLTKLENERQKTITSVQNAIRLGFIVGGISFILAIGLGLFIYRSISKPIARLKEAAVNIAKGNLDATVETKAKDEIGVLARSFNQMTENLRNSRDMLEGQTQRLARSNSELEQFAYVTTHDLQEPLRKVQVFGDLLVSKSGDSLSEEGNGYLRRMQDAARRMQTLINDLLSFSRVSTQVQPYVAVDLTELTQEVLSDLEPLITGNGGRVDVGELPTIDADPTQMRQLQQNLISNALKFHKPEEPPLVRISGRLLNGHEGSVSGRSLSEGTCEITVEDNGIGFDEKYLDRIFTVFQRLHGRDTYEGTGIGLATCRKIVERHGGRITARSRPGEGARFIVTLPARHSKGGSQSE